jgi:hypothetical protein
VPHLLSVSPLDCESLTVTFCFQFNYEGNHSALLAEVLGVPSSLEGVTNNIGISRLVAFDPSFRIAISEDCRTQARVHFKNHTSACHVRNGEFPDEAVGVCLTIYGFGSLASGETYVSRFDELVAHGDAIIEKQMMGQVLLPLQQAIGIK